MDHKPQVVVIGLDGATWKILDPLINQGKLPFLAQFKRHGLSGVLQSTTPPISAPAWASFQTGTNPGQHGVFNFYHRRVDPMHPPVINSDSVRGNKLRQYLNAAQLSTLLVNKPLSYPIKPVRGILISSFLTPSGATFAYPKNLEYYLNRTGYRIDVQSGQHTDLAPNIRRLSRQPKKMLKLTQDTTTTRARVFTSLFHQKDYDYAFIYFKSTDIMQHLYWGTYTLTSFWRHIDRTLANLYTDCHNSGPQYWFIISDHGFHPLGKTVVGIFPWLNQLLSQHNPSTYPTSSNHILRTLYSRVKRLGLAPDNLPLIKWIRQIFLQRLETYRFNYYIYSLGILPTIEGIYFLDPMLKTRLLSAIIASSQRLSYHKQAVFSLVAPASNVYRGKYLGEGPDIVWQVNPEFRLDLSPLTDRIFYPASQTHLKAEHYADPEGIVMINGPGIPILGELKYHITDILPTILKIYGLDIPSHLDGQPIPHIKSYPKPAQNNRHHDPYVHHLSI